MPLTYQKTKEREAVVQKMISDGLSVYEIAKALDRRPETIRRFLQRRGWETDTMREHRERKKA